MSAVVQLTPLNLLTIDLNGAVVRVKVFVTWKKTYFNNPNSTMSLEMILIDAQVIEQSYFFGNKIRASVPKRWVSFYEPTFVEGKYLELSNFGVVDCDDKVKLIPNALKISIFRSTTINVCHLFEIATEGYSPVHFQELLEWRFSKDAVFDVLGALVEMKPMCIKRENGVDNKSLEFTLKDNRCALWAHHATRVFEYVSARKNDIDSIVLLMHNCKLKE
ncbi:uncharacterized protein [Rutidosis leptorrhynchoides]|uniref:uncharacterized protein n=1 Tax=Rutidosis leptorrhynchoides TaxID=125765 RepID=UPI003A9A582C